MGEMSDYYNDYEIGGETVSEEQTCTCGCHDKTRELSAKVSELEDTEKRLLGNLAESAQEHIKDRTILQAKVRELEAVVAADGREIYDLLEREKHTQATYEETGQKIIDQHNQIQELLRLVRLLKQDAADGTSNQHFRDGAEAFGRWAVEHPPITLSGYKEPEDHYIQRGLEELDRVQCNHDWEPCEDRSGDTPRIGRGCRKCDAFEEDR